MNFVGRKEIIKEVQKILGLVEDGEDGPKTWNAIAQKLGINVKQETSTPKPTSLSPKALKLILDYEVGGGEAYYNRFLKHPCWPGGASGVTIGVGYDLGYNTLEQFTTDWKHLLSDSDFSRLSKKVGIKGNTAAREVVNVDDIEIPWDAAFQVFQSNTIPRFIEQTLNAFPHADELHPDAFGALVSIVFNRGASVSGDSRREMLLLRLLVPSDDYAGMAREVRNMKRLWENKGLPGLLKRREAEAKLIESCIGK